MFVFFICQIFSFSCGVVGWCEGVVYLTSPGRSTDISLQLGKAGKVSMCFYFFCFFTFIPVPLSSLSLSFISSTNSSISFLPFCGRRHKMTHTGGRVVKTQHNQIFLLLNLISLLSSFISPQGNDVHQQILILQASVFFFFFLFFFCFFFFYHIRH